MALGLNVSYMNRVRSWSIWSYFLSVSTYHFTHFYAMHLMVCPWYCPSFVRFDGHNNSRHNNSHGKPPQFRDTWTEDHATQSSQNLLAIGTNTYHRQNENASYKWDLCRLIYCTYVQFLKWPLIIVFTVQVWYAYDPIPIGVEKMKSTFPTLICQ